MDIDAEPQLRQRAAGSKFKYWANKLAVKETEPGLSTGQLMLINEDLKPVEVARRVWGPWNFVGFWVADCFNINTWMIGASMVVAGLNWWQAWLCVWIGYFVAGSFVVLAGRIGAVYHISYPIVSRASFGIWGGLWPVLNRTVMACVWYGVQCYIGGNCVYVMIRAIWKNWGDIPNTFPANADTNTPHFVSFFLFWFLSLPAIWFPVHQIRHLFTVKSFVVPVAGIAFLIWTVVRAGGVGPVIRQPATATGTEWSWAFVQGIMSSIANFATLIVNDADFTRFAAKPKDALWSQFLTIPIGFALTSLIGIFVSSASGLIYGEVIWNPIDVLDNFITDGNSGERFAIFLLGLAFALAQLGTNIAANSVSAGTDMTALVPRYINIRRGGYVCAAVGLAMCPWTLLGSSSMFTTYLSAYSVFLSSIAGVMISDYYFVRKGYLILEDLYSAKKTSTYYFSFGFHWRGYAAYIAGILINVVGFADAVGAKNVPMGAIYIYRVNFFTGFIVASSTYYLLCRFFPIPGTSDKWMEVGQDVDEVTVAYGADHSQNHPGRYDEENAYDQKGGDETPPGELRDRRL